MARAKTLKSDISIEAVLEAALELFSSQGYGATSMRQIAEKAGVSVGNIYHHFKNKELIFQRLLDRYWEIVLDPELKLNRIFSKAEFPDDLEDLADAIEEVVNNHSRKILLIYVDVIEFRGAHIRKFYETMAVRFEAQYGKNLAKRKKKGELTGGDPLVGVMLAVRWFFYFFTVEKSFGVPMHFGMDNRQAIDEFIRIMRYGVLPRGNDGRQPDKLHG
ncbi:MAG: TetR/AcrR family transcriptional regulator [Acidobacteria bacterium]|nr:TetR/AcrR family transcriptional regulator [Acidobacteriota bacterium]